MSIKLVILGLLMEGSRHPYEIQQIIQQRQMHNYIKMQAGSLYYAMDQLRKEGCVEAVEVIRDTSRPDKTIYRITEAGREKFQELLMQQFASKSRVYHPLHAALSFARYGDQTKIAFVLAERIKDTEALALNMKRLYEEHSRTVPRAVLHMMLGSYEHAKVQVNWLKRLHQDALEGRLHEIGAPLKEELEHEQPGNL